LASLFPGKKKKKSSLVGRQGESQIEGQGQGENDTLDGSIESNKTSNRFFQLESHSFSTKWCFPPTDEILDNLISQGFSDLENFLTGKYSWVDQSVQIVDIFLAKSNKIKQNQTKSNKIKQNQTETVSYLLWSEK